MPPHSEAQPHGSASPHNDLDGSAVALLFLTIRDVKNPDIWEGWLKDAPEGSFNIYVHAKVCFAPVDPLSHHPLCVAPGSHCLVEHPQND